MKRTKAKPVVLLTRDATGNKAWAREFSREGITTAGIATITTVPIISASLSNALAAIDTFDWVVFTSAAAPRSLAALPEGKRLHPRASRVALPHAAAIGKETARAGRSAGFTVSFMPKETTAAGLARELPDVRGKRMLMLRARDAGTDVARVLRARGARVRDIALYATVSVHGVDARTERLLNAEAVSHIVFASPSAVRGLKKRLSRNAFARARALPVIAIGPKTLAAAKKHGFSRARSARPFTLDGIIRTLRA